jgi:hypothetical protein
MVEEPDLVVLMNSKSRFNLSKEAIQEIKDPQLT